jgi:glycosyltransferase involved in cell wall biosynthesis
MKMKANYNVIVPRLDNTGPTNVALDLAKIALSKGYNVKLFYLSGSITRTDLGQFNSINKLQIFTLSKVKGIVHTHGLRPDLLGALLSFKKNCITVSTLHGQYPHHISQDYSQWKLFLGWAAWSTALTKIKYVVCISQTMQRYYKRFLPKMKTEVVYNFRSLSDACTKHNSDSFSRWLQLQRQYSRFVVLYVGSITIRKDIVNFLKQFEKINDVSFAVCGNGNLTEEMLRLKSFATEKNFYLGQVNDPTTIMSQCDALVLPSKAEGFPLVVLESYFTHKPVLLSNIAVHRELSNLGLGFIFNKHSQKDFIMKLIDVLKSQGNTLENHGLSQKLSPANGFAEYEKIFLNVGGQ